MGESTPGGLLLRERPAYDLIAGQRMGERRSSPRAQNVRESCEA